MMIRSCVMMNDSRDTSMKFASLARTAAYSVVFADSRIALVSSNQTCATPR
ncbi:MAG: hypothetical protein ABSC63_17250 [Candidatus Binataceae bacterium]|jgi:hypothetical protein